jgi:hypothetical protein
VAIERDGFDEPGTWWIGSDDVASSVVTGGNMLWTIKADGTSVWDDVGLSTPLDRVRVDATVLVGDGSGGGGTLCAGADAGTHSLWAGINGDGEWLVGRIVDTRLQLAERGDAPRVRRHDVPVGAPYPWLVTLECTADPVAGDRVRLWVEGVQVADVVDDAVGPYARVGLVGSADTGGLSITFDDFTVYGDPGPDPSPSD